MTFNIISRVPNSPFLNENWYVVFSTDGATFTGAFCTVASVVSPIRASGASYIAFYPAGTVATGTYTIYGFRVKGATGTFVNDKTIQIRNSEIADPAKTLYDILRNNVGSSYASVAFSTGWFSDTVNYPQVTVTRNRRTDETMNLFDTFREHEETLYVDTWITGRAFGVGVKNAHTLLDGEVKRIINSQRKAPSTKLRHMQIVDSQFLPEIEDRRKLFRTRHGIRVKWDESIA